MTVDEIKKLTAADLSANSWMREICIQLALLNEKRNNQQNQQRQGR